LDALARLRDTTRRKRGTGKWHTANHHRRSPGQDSSSGSWAASWPSSSFVCCGGIIWGITSGTIPAMFTSCFNGCLQNGPQLGPVDVLASRILRHPTDLAASREFYRDRLGLAVYREFGPRDNPSVVFHLGGGSWSFPDTATKPRVTTPLCGCRCGMPKPSTSGSGPPVCRSCVRPDWNAGADRDVGRRSGRPADRARGDPGTPASAGAGSTPRWRRIMIPRSCQRDRAGRATRRRLHTAPHSETCAVMGTSRAGRGAFPPQPLRMVWSGGSCQRPRFNSSW